MKRPIRAICYSAIALILPTVKSVALRAENLPPLKTVAAVDLNRYAGRWYEIARYPNRFQKMCDRDVTADYSLNPNGSVRVVNRCLKRDGKAEQVTGTAKVVDTSTNSKLKVTFFWPFYGKYWIIELGPGYEYAVIGEPSRNYVWILSRSPSMRDSTYQEILSRLPGQGYDPKKLVRTTQPAPAAGDHADILAGGLRAASR